MRYVMAVVVFYPYVLNFMYCCCSSWRVWCYFMWHIWWTLCVSAVVIFMIFIFVGFHQKINFKSFHKNYTTNFKKITRKWISHAGLHFPPYFVKIGYLVCTECLLIYKVFSLTKVDFSKYLKISHFVYYFTPPMYF